MTGRSTSTVLLVGVLCTLSGYVLGSGTEDFDIQRCAAVPVAPYFPVSDINTLDTSEACFIRASEVGDSINEYFLVDVSSSPSLRSLFPQAIHLRSRQIKSTPSLRGKPLLIVSEPYKRYSMAKLCHELIESGFLTPKILLNDIPVTPGAKSIGSVSPEDFLVEVSNFGAVVIASDQEVADQLDSLGLPAWLPEKGLKSQFVYRAISEYSLDGYLPVFVVGESVAGGKVELVAGEKLVNSIFLVSGGIESIERSLNVRALSAIKRNNNQKVSSCVR
ncbi:hypothetical protein [Microbulbifer sp. YPW1]|uniref:hypothetical protein n=1 Tax=Microbulbifer sp. YPW1 TaxID=2745199 RepID=UPI001598B630|nr:hypothetical protein [Microbulbifer sp. YPW1]QKX18575.1 hypothetical protein HUW35_17250 [Microbulbifer sp. YPW1]